MNCTRAASLLSVLTHQACFEEHHFRLQEGEVKPAMSCVLFSNRLRLLWINSVYSTGTFDCTSVIGRRSDTEGVGISSRS